MSASLPADPAGTLFARHALLEGGWAHDVLLHWDAQGTLSSVDHGATPPPSVPQASGPVVPGLPNLHSHAFQRVFAGFTEQRSGAADSFWSWRERMYRVALAVSPAQLEEIATLLYIEMLCAGYTSVCEFHYLHHAPDGQPYADPAEMSLRLAAAARRAGIALTLLPVLYQQSGFGAHPPRDEQRRFIHSVDGLLRVVERLRAEGVPIGVAPHSLRAVAPPALSELLAGLRGIDAGAPVHIHIAEQVQEVEECLAWSGARPVQWLLDHASVDARWCLVHATHMTSAEAAAIAASGATIGLCPSTEANLGDGVFDAVDFVARGGHWGIGSDSHASVDAFEELRLLEYTQRLHTRGRNVLASAARPQVADAMWLAAVSGGARAEGRGRSTQFPAGAARAGLMAGAAANFLVLDQSGDRAELTPAQLLATQVFAPRRAPAVREAWVAGRRVVREGHHPLHERACENFVTVRRQLLAGL